MTIRSRAMLVLVGAAVFAACADQPTGPTQVLGPSLAVVGKPNIASPITFEGQLWVCKEAGADIGVNFTFNWAITNYPSGTPFSSGTATIASGQCAQVASVSTSTTGIRYRASITEGALPTDWSFSSIVVDYNLQTTPVILGQTVSNLFLTNDVGSVVTFTNVYTPPGGPLCSLTWGFWKNHQSLWDTNGEMTVWTGQLFFNSGKTYAEILATPPAKGNSYLQLAHQYIAAVLNVNGGSDPVIDAAIAAAAARFASLGAGVWYIKDKDWTDNASTLDNYNTGVTGPGHCSE